MSTNTHRSVSRSIDLGSEPGHILIQFLWPKKFISARLRFYSSPTQTHIHTPFPASCTCRLNGHYFSIYPSLCLWAQTLLPGSSVPPTFASTFIAWNIEMERDNSSVFGIYYGVLYTTSYPSSSLLALADEFFNLSHTRSIAIDK